MQELLLGAMCIKMLSEQHVTSYQDLIKDSISRTQAGKASILKSTDVDMIRNFIVSAVTKVSLPLQTVAPYFNAVRVLI